MMKKIIALALSATMILGSALTVFAETPGAVSKNSLPITPAQEFEGDGTSMGYVELGEIIKVQLSTTPEGKDFAMTMDPQGLLNTADGTMFPIKSGAVYFGVSENATGVVYKNESISYNIISKSSVSLNAAMKVDIKEYNGDPLTNIKLVPKASLNTVTDPSLYVGIKSDFNSVSDETELTTSINSVTKMLDKVGLWDGLDPTTGYKLTVSKNAPTDPSVSYNTLAYGYKGWYDLDAGYTPKGTQSVTYILTASCNDVASWGKIKTNAIKTVVTYDIKSAEEGSATVLTGVKITNASGSTTYSTAATLASRLASGAVVFSISSSDKTTYGSDLFAKSVTKIEVDGVAYSFTPESTTTVANSDGKTYRITGYAGSSASNVKVYYGTEYIVEYNL